MTLAGLRRVVGAFVLVAAQLVWAVPASAGSRETAGAFAAGKAVSVEAAARGAKRVTYRVGPFTVKPGQNDIGYAPILERPQVDGYITRIRPDLTYLDGRVPGRRRDPPPSRRLAQPVAPGCHRARRAGALLRVR